MLLNKKVIVLAAYTVILFVTAPKILGNAIITGSALLTYLSLCFFTLLLMERYDKWRAQRALRNS